MQLNKEQVKSLEEILGTDKACIMINVHKEDTEDDDPKLAFRIFAGDGEDLSEKEMKAIEIAIHGMIWFAINEGDKLVEYYIKFTEEMYKEANELADKTTDLKNMEPVGSA